MPPGLQYILYVTKQNKSELVFICIICTVSLIFHWNWTFYLFYFIHLFGQNIIGFWLLGESVNNIIYIVKRQLQIIYRRYLYTHITPCSWSCHILAKWWWAFHFEKGMPPDLQYGDQAKQVWTWIKWKSSFHLHYYVRYYICHIFRVIFWWKFHWNWTFYLLYFIYLFGQNTFESVAFAYWAKASIT